MRVLVISQTYGEWNCRAKWRRLVELYDDVTIKVITPRLWPDVISHVHAKPESLVIDGKKRFEVQPSFTFFAGYEIYHSYPALLGIIRAFRPDIIQVETGSNSLALFFSIIFCKLLFLKTKVVFFSWINWLPHFGWKYRVFYEWIERFNLKHVSGALLGNTDSKKIFQGAKRFTKPVLVLPQLGTDPQIFSFRASPPEKFVIGFAGRFVPEKGLDTLLEACVILKDRGVDFQLLLAGAGPYEHAIREAIVRLALQEQCDFVGALSHQEVIAFYKRCSVLVLPSYDTPTWKEQFGQVLVQAMLSGVVVVGSDAGAIPDVIGRSDVIFRQKDAHHLAEILIKLQGDAAYYQSLVKFFREHAITHFSDAAIARQTYEFWRGIGAGCSLRHA